MRNRLLRVLLVLLCAAMPPAISATDATLSIAAASDLQFALKQVVRDFEAQEPGARVHLVFGSSGKLSTQIRQGAPFDLFFSADLSYAQALVDQGLTVGGVHPYATGRLVLWSARENVSTLTLADLGAERYARIAIANPRHAPYGQRAAEAIRASGVWEAIQDRLVYGENVSQTAQFVRSGNAQVGIVALSLVLDPALEDIGSHALIPQTLHQPLEQGHVLLRRAASKPVAQRFLRHLEGPAARAILAAYGFEIQGRQEDAER